MNYEFRIYFVTRLVLWIRSKCVLIQKWWRLKGLCARIGDEFAPKLIQSDCIRNFLVFEKVLQQLNFLDIFEFLFLQNQNKTKVFRVE